MIKLESEKEVVKYHNHMVSFRKAEGTGISLERRWKELDKMLKQFREQGYLEVPVNP